MYSGVLHILCCVFDLFFFILCSSLIAPSLFSNVYLLKLKFYNVYDRVYIFSVSYLSLFF
jgi:hypothetical protein